VSEPLPLPLQRVSTVDAVVAALRARILDGDLPAGSRLVERELVGARCGHLGAAVGDQLEGLYELRTALEMEAARLALARDPQGLQEALDHAAAELRSIAESDQPHWSDVVDGHAAVHRAIIDSAGSPRIAGAYAALDAEMRLFLIALRPVWSLQRMAAHHEALARDLPARGPEALREHLADGAATVLGDG
jgi:DNA-binding GntR family transcriptional regulator